MEHKEDDYTTPLCLSFSSYTCDRTAEIVDRVRLELPGESNDDEYEFEFVNLPVSSSSSSSSNCDFVFPTFNHILSSTVKPKAKVKTQLKDLFLSDHEDRCSSLSGGWRRSKSTGTSSSRIKDLFKRSYSERKQPYKLLNSNSTNRERNIDESSKKKENVVSCSAFEKFYLKKKAMKEEEKRKSYLPYKKDFFGFIFNIHRYGKTLNPF